MSSKKKGAMISDDQFLQHRLQLLNIMRKPGKIRGISRLTSEHDHIRKMKKETRIHKLKSKLDKS